MIGSILIAVESFPVLSYKQVYFIAGIEYTSKPDFSVMVHLQNQYFPVLSFKIRYPASALTDAQLMKLSKFLSREAMISPKGMTGMHLWRNWWDF